MMKKTFTAAAALATFAATLPGMASAGGVEVTPSVEISSMYLYRGENAGGSNPFVAGGLQADYQGAYAGISALSAEGSEYDTYVGYAQSIADVVTVDLSVWAYTLPADDAYDTFGQYSEAFLTFTYDMLWFTVASNLAGDTGMRYYNTGASVENFSVGVGLVDADEDQYTYVSATPLDEVVNDYIHVDLTYAYNDSLKFTLSQIVDQGKFTLNGRVRDDRRDEDTLFVATYNVPFE
jgi:uncharacterized protein (TIGR02001 family)